MHKLLAAAGLVVGLGLTWSQNANAFPAQGSMPSAIAAPAVQQVQYSERYTRHYVVKCYRDFVIGRYSCHRYRRYW